MHIYAYSNDLVIGKTKKRGHMKNENSVKSAILFLIGMTVMNSAFAADSISWRIDEPFRFNLAYLPSQTQRASGTAVMEPLLKTIPSYRPDITNIPYKNILELGFPLPPRKDADSLKLYLKLYTFPSTLNAVRSSHKILDDFLLYQIPGGRRLYEFSAQQPNVAIKFASIDVAHRAFTPERPFQSPTVPAQWEFDSEIPFSTIYVKPEGIGSARSESEQAKQSTQGVINFRAAVRTAYDSSFHFLGAENEKRTYADFRRCPDRIDRFCGVRVYELPEAIIFTNYRDLPMPQDEKKVFVSSLLLIKLTDYTIRTPLTNQERDTFRVPELSRIQSTLTPLSSHILEVSSLLDMRATDNSPTTKMNEEK